MGGWAMVARPRGVVDGTGDCGADDSTIVGCRSNRSMGRIVMYGGAAAPWSVREDRSAALVQLLESLTKLRPEPPRHAKLLNRLLPASSFAHSAACFPDDADPISPRQTALRLSYEPSSGNLPSAAAARTQGYVNGPLSCDRRGQHTLASRPSNGQ